MTSKAQLKIYVPGSILNKARKKLRKVETLNMSNLISELLRIWLKHG